MKPIIFLLLFVSTIFSQNNDDLLILSVVNSDSIIIPVAGFYGDSLVNFFNSPNNLAESELKISEWHYYPFESQPTKIFVRETLKFPTGEDGLDTTYGFNFGHKDVFGLSNKLSGIASNRAINLSHPIRVKKDANSNIFQKIPKSIHITHDLRDSLKNAYPEVVFSDSIIFPYNHITSISFKDEIYYEYVNYYFIDGAYNYTNWIYNSGWLLVKNNSYEILSETPRLSIHTEQEMLIDEGNITEERKVLGVTRYGGKLYYISQISVWKNIYYEVTEVVF